MKEKPKISRCALVFSVLIAVVYVCILVGGLLAYLGEYPEFFVLLTGESEGFLAEEVPTVARVYGFMLLTLVPTAAMVFAATRMPFRFDPWLRLLIIAGALAASIWVSTFYIDALNQVHYQGHYQGTFKVIFYSAPYLTLALITLATVIPVLTCNFDGGPAVLRFFIMVLFSYPIYLASVFAYLIAAFFLFGGICMLLESRQQSHGRIYIFYYEE